jgi:hypothetical protein
MKRTSRWSASGFAETADSNPFAVFEIIAEARKIQQQSTIVEITEGAKRIEHHADGIIKTILGTSDLSTAEVPASVIEQIVELLRTNRQ